jgi:hypothetical protein
MKILVVAEDFPWPSTGGGLIRLATVVETLSRLGEVDLFTLFEPGRTDLVPPSGVEVARLATTPWPTAPHQLRWRTAWATQRGLPMEVVIRQSDPTPRRALDAWAAERYDLVWFSTAYLYAWTGRPQRGPTVVDLMDREDEKARQRARLLRGQRTGAGAVARIRLTAAAAQAGKNSADWRSFQSSVAGTVDRVVLSSEEDRRLAGLPNAVVVPNTFPAPSRAVGRTAVGHPPSILLQGSLRYAPNIDAVEWLVGEIVPRLKAAVPDARIRLVGRPTDGVGRYDRPPAVTVVGSVPDMVPELERADIAVVPLRIGSGTRLKILESFAHRVPVVSTSLGAEGLGVRDGVHLLVADDADAFAAACERLLTDLDLRARLADAAEELYLAHYQRSVARERIVQLVGEVADLPSDG